MMEFKIIFAFQIPQLALLAALSSAALAQRVQCGLLHRCGCLQELGLEASELQSLAGLELESQRWLIRADRTAQEDTVVTCVWYQEKRFFFC